MQLLSWVGLNGKKQRQFQSENTCWCLQKVKFDGDFDFLLLFPFCRGHSFLSLNEGLLERYSECATAAEVIAAQQEYLDSLKRVDSSDEDSDDGGHGGGGGGGGYLRARDLPPSDSDEYEHSDDEEEVEEEDAVIVGVQRLGLVQKEEEEKEEDG